MLCRRNEQKLQQTGEPVLRKYQIFKMSSKIMSNFKEVKTCLMQDREIRVKEGFLAKCRPSLMPEVLIFHTGFN